MSNCIVKIDNLDYKIKNKTILQNISFNLFDGEIVFLLGRNGAGKTTLFSLLTGLYKCQKESEIKIFDLDIKKHSHKIFKKLGVVFQQRTLDLDLSVKQNLMYFAQLHGLSKKEAQLRINEELTSFNLEKSLNNKIRILSGGQIRAIELVRALLIKPELLLLDEPTVGLDVESRLGLIKHIRMLAEQKLSVLWSTHLINEIDINDKVIIIDNGKILSMGYAKDIIKNSETNNLQDAFVKLTGRDVYE